MLRKMLVGLALTSSLALAALIGPAGASAFTLVYSNGEWNGETGPKHTFSYIVRDEVEGRKQAWCMNTYRSNGETLTGMGTYCHAAGGSHVQWDEEEVLVVSSTAQGWVNSSSKGFIWAWGEYE